MISLDRCYPRPRDDEVCRRRRYLLTHDEDVVVIVAALQKKKKKKPSSCCWSRVVVNQSLVVALSLLLLLFMGLPSCCEALIATTRPPLQQLQPRIIARSPTTTTTPCSSGQQQRQTTTHLPLYPYTTTDDDATSTAWWSCRSQRNNHRLQRRRGRRRRNPLDHHHLVADDDDEARQMRLLLTQKLVNHENENTEIEHHRGEDDTINDDEEEDEYTITGTTTATTTKNEVDTIVDVAMNNLNGRSTTSISSAAAAAAVKTNGATMPSGGAAASDITAIASAAAENNTINNDHDDPTTTTTTTGTVSASAAAVVMLDETRDDDVDDDYYNPNGIHPHTMSLTQSISYFCQFVMQRMIQNQKQQRYNLVKSRIEKRQQKGQQKQKTATRKWIRQLQLLNEQRRNLVVLADYSAKIVTPSLISLMVGALMTSIIPHYYAQSIQLVATVSETNVSQLIQALIGLFVTTTLAALFTGLRGALFWIAGSRANYNIRVKLHRNLLLQETAFFDANEIGYLLSRLNSDVNKIGQVISYHVNVVLRQFAQFVFGSIYLIRISPILSLYTFGGIGLVALVSAVYGAFNRDLAQRVQDTFADATAVAETSFAMSETIRAFDGVQTESRKYESAQTKALQLEEVQAWGYGTHKFVSDTLQGSLQIMILLCCYYYGKRSMLPAEQLTQFIFYTWFVLESSNEVGDQWAKIQGAVGASSYVFDLIRRIPLVRDPPVKRQQQQNLQLQSQRLLNPSTTIMVNGASYNDDGPVPVVDAVSVSAAGLPSPIQQQPQSSSTGTSMITAAADSRMNDDDSTAVDRKDGRRAIITMSNVTLTYVKMAIPALSNVDLTINEGDRIAIVGRSGSGKSSMLRCMLRFYDPTNGTICLDDVPLTQLSRQQLSEQIAVVEQEPSLFPMTLIENVLYGIPYDSTNTTTGEECYSPQYEIAVTKALDEAGLSIYPGNDLNLDLYTRVGEGGRSLSGGQRQRVAIARALIRHPSVLLLDEPTAALDTESEKTVLTALQRAMQYASCMAMVTHRLNVVSALNVNRVIVMDKGHIVEMGHPTQLMQQNNSVYAALVREQGLSL